MMKDTADWFISKQFVAWMVVGVPAFTVVSALVMAVQPPYYIAVAAGVILCELTDPVLDWLADWKRAEQTIEQNEVSR